ncbi:hypothetical protein JCM11491_001246 [Sporobolomyces phaffii]
MEATLSTSPCISQSSTPRPRSASGERASPGPPALDPNLLSLPTLFTGERAELSAAREQDPISALAGPSQPFFMSRPSHEFDPSPPRPPSTRDDVIHSRDSLRVIPSPWHNERGSDEPWRPSAPSEEAPSATRPDQQTRLCEVVASLEGKLSRLIETVRDLQLRLDFVERAAFERDRQLDHLLRATTGPSQQRPFDGSLSSRYFAPPALSYASTTEMTPPESLHDFSLTPSTSYASLPFVDLAPNHRRTVSTPIRSTESSQARPHPYAATAHENLPVSFTTVPPTQLLRTIPGPPGPPYAPAETFRPPALRRSLFGGYPRPQPGSTPSHSRATSASSSGGSGGPLGGSKRDEELPQTPSRPFREDGYNYRGLLENDSEIEEDIFVRRVFLQNDQQCSLFLQQRVKLTTSLERRQRLLESVGRHLLDLSASKFGNFLVSRCIEAADQNLIQLYSARFAGHFLELSLDPFGCHVVQKLLDRCDPATKERVIDELSPFPNTLLQKSSLHVWNRLLSQPNSPSFYSRLANQVGAGSWRHIVLEEGGSLIVQHLLEDWSGGEGVHASVVARELLEGLEAVAQSACGSFVLAAFIDRNFLPFRTRVMELATRLALDSFGAKLVERVVKLSSKGGGGGGGNGGGELLTKFIDEITSSRGDDQEPPLLLSIASHAAGSSLLSFLVSSSTAPYPDKAKLVRCISTHRARMMDEGGVHAARLSSLVGAAPPNSRA